jgi:predicted transcriptional regulator
MAESDGETISDLPPSAKLVFKVLEYNGPMTQKGIVEESMLSARTVRYALERLEDIDIVSEDVYFADARQNLYEIIPEHEEVDENGEPVPAAADD